MEKLIKKLIDKYFQLKWRFASLRIRQKLIIILGLLFIGLFSILSFVIIQKGQQILSARLAQTCELSLQHISRSIKDDLLLYYTPDANNQVNSEKLGHIREAIYNLANEKIEGLKYSCVIDKNGNYIAIVDSSNSNWQNTQISKKDSVLFSNLDDKHIREKDGIIEYIHPILAKGSGDRQIFLGVTVLGFYKNKIMRPIRQATQTIIIFSIGIIFISVFAISFVAQRMTRQIDALSIGVRKVARGELDSEIPLLSYDELGKLAAEFNKLVVHLREKQQMQQYVSQLTMQKIKNGELEMLPPEGENRQVTVLFTDVRNFTLLTERLGPKEIVKLINIYHDLQAAIVEENNGYIDKFYGDQIMAIFIGKNQAKEAIRTAVEIQKTIKMLNRKRAASGKVTFFVGCGVNLGNAIMGKMGSKSRMDFTVIGDVVNLAARLCSIAKAGQILAPSHIKPHLNTDYPTVQLEPVKVKGLKDPVSIIEIGYDKVFIM